ncbi:MAG TPA: ATP-binding protein, partial [Burkholderiaceae bacterium]
LRPSVIRVSDLIAGMEDLLRRAIGDFTQIETHIAPDVWNVLVDPNQLENVLLNLALNARDAMAGAGKILIEAGNVAGFQPHAGTPDAPAAGEYVKIAVCDTGSGMADDVMQRAFEPFFTTKPVGEGTGLGLSMAYGFVKQSGGHIELHSRVGHGTTVKIYLPRVEQDAGQLRQLGGGAVTGGSETVLVVEDEPEVRSTTVELLQSLGYKTLQASDAQSALTLLQCGLEVDLLFSDVVMPGPLRSDELVVEAQRLRPALKVLFASGYVDERIVRDGQLMAGIELLKKPYSVDDLAQHVRQVLSSKVA